jgi:hypothetical protein
LVTGTPSKGTPYACSEKFVPFPVPISLR